MYVYSWYNILVKKLRKVWIPMVLNTYDNSTLLEIIKQQNETIEMLKRTIEQMNADSKLLHEQIDYLTKKLFGRKSEKTMVVAGQIAMDAVVFGQFDKAEQGAKPSEEEPEIINRK